MRRILRAAFAGLLSLALAASGATLGIASHLAAHQDGAPHAHHADHAALTGDEHQHHAHHHALPTDDNAPQPASNHVSKSCCTACTVASPLPPTPDLSIELIVSPAVYPNLTRFDVALSVPIDPGIPKRMG